MKKPVWEDRSVLLKKEREFIEELERGAKQKLFIDINERNEIVELSTLDCGIKKIPEGLGRLKPLEYFDIKDDKISELPSSIGDLHELKHLLIY